MARRGAGGNVTLQSVIPSIDLEDFWVSFGIMRRKGKAGFHMLFAV